MFEVNDLSRLDFYIVNIFFCKFYRDIFIKIILDDFSSFITILKEITRLFGVFVFLFLSIWFEHVEARY